MNTATAIKLWRVRRGLTQFSLCQAAAMPSIGRYSLIERGLVQPRPDEIERLARVLDVAAGELFPEAAHEQRA